MDKASDSGSGDCQFDSDRGYIFQYPGYTCCHGHHALLVYSTRAGGGGDRRPASGSRGVAEHPAYPPPSPYSAPPTELLSPYLFSEPALELRDLGRGRHDAAHSTLPSRVTLYPYQFVMLLWLCSLRMLILCHVCDCAIESRGVSVRMCADARRIATGGGRVRHVPRLLPREEESVGREQKKMLFALREKATVTDESRRAISVSPKPPCPKPDTTLWPAAL